MESRNSVQSQTCFWIALHCKKIATLERERISDYRFATVQSGVRGPGLNRFFELLRAHKTRVFGEHPLLCTRADAQQFALRNIPDVADHIVGPSGK